MLIVKLLEQSVQVSSDPEVTSYQSEAEKTSISQHSLKQASISQDQAVKRLRTLTKLVLAVKPASVPHEKVSW